MAERRHGKAQDDELEEEDPVRASIRERIRQDASGDRAPSARRDMRLIGLVVLLMIFFLLALGSGERIAPEYYLFALVTALFVADRLGLDRYIRRRMKREPEDGADSQPTRYPDRLSMPDFVLTGTLLICSWWVINEYEGPTEQVLIGLIIGIAVVRVFFWNSFTHKARNTASNRARRRG